MRNSIRIALIDYGIGNIYSVQNAIKELGYSKILITDSEKEIRLADVLILPGVGAFEACAVNLKQRNLIPILNEVVLDNKKPILGICVGMQLLATFSEENGIHAGLNWIDGRVVKLDLPREYSVPHVGWNNVNINITAPLFEKNNTSTNFYFDHSYHFQCDEQYVSAYCDYGRKVVAAVQKDNIFGVQFHPEKSQTSGLKMFRSFFNSI